MPQFRHFSKRGCKRLINVDAKIKDMITNQFLYSPKQKHLIYKNERNSIYNQPKFEHVKKT